MAVKQVNPRSYASIRNAMKEGDLNSRGEVLRAIHNAFRTPIIAKRESASIEEPQLETPAPKAKAKAKPKPISGTSSKA